MDTSNLTKVVRFEITDNGFVFYDEQGSVPNPENSYWNGSLDFRNDNIQSIKGLPHIIEGNLDLEFYQGKSLKGLPSVVNGYLDLRSYNGESLEGLPSVVNGSFWLLNYKGNDYNNLPKEYKEIFIKDRWYKKSEFDDWWKTEKLKKALLD